jgi:zinc-ribbon domain
LFCPACGTNNEDNVRFCLRCGRQLHDGTASKPDTGPAWSDFVQPVPEPVPEIPMPLPLEPPPMPTLPPPPQVVVGGPKREMPTTMLAGILVAIGAIAAAAFGIYYATQNVDRNSLPIIGAKNTPSASAVAPGILISLTSTCKDTNDQDCNLNWDLTAVKSDPAGLRVEYEVRATGQAGCSVPIKADQAVASSLESAGRPGPFVEGARGRYYPLTSSEGLTQTGGSLSCDQKQQGAWIFSAVTGESFVKLRYPGLPPARVELDPLSVQALPADDPLSVIPVQQTNCQAVDSQPCSGVWEIGPYGVAPDGAPIVFFAVRFDGAAGCQVNWQPDTAGSDALIAKGDRGIGLELADNTGFLLLTSGGGLSSANGPLTCGTVFTGFWRFTPGSVSPLVNLIYPDFPLVQIPIKP